AWNENAEKTQERIEAMYEDMLESGADFLSRQFVEQRLQAIYGRAEDAVIAWEQLQAIVQRTGMTEEEVAAAFAGNAELQAELMDKLTGKLDEHRQAVEAGTIAQGDGAIATEAGILRQIEALQRQIDETETATDRVKGYRAAVATLDDQHVTEI